jgi:hypothetical protein
MSEQQAGSNPAPKPQSPAERREKDAEFKERELRTKALLLGQARRSLAVRTKDREFHGLEREFLYAQSQMLVDYEKSKDIKHPRDVGNAREQILGKFLGEKGFLPHKYAVSNTSVRAASSEGFVSSELDILLFDRDEGVTLMTRERAYEVYPVEVCYGTIQVKSKLTKAELKKAFDNVSSFKRLKKCGVSSGKFDHGFGIIFAYDTDLGWMEVIEEIKKLAAEHPRTAWPNAVVILSKGMFIFGDGRAGKFLNEEIELLEEIKVHGFPDRQDQCLYTFFDILVTMLRNSEVCSAPFGTYFRLPLTAGNIPYEFVHSFFAELGKCPKHGDYQRKISQESMEKLLAYCKITLPQDFAQILNAAYGDQLTQEGKTWGQGTSVWVYNPENRPLPEIMIAQTPMPGPGITGLTFDEVRCRGIDFNILIPFCYSRKDGIVSGCPACTNPKPKGKKKKK